MHSILFLIVILWPFGLLTYSIFFFLLKRQKVRQRPYGKKKEATQPPTQSPLPPLTVLPSCLLTHPVYSSRTSRPYCQPINRAYLPPEPIYPRRGLPTLTSRPTDQPTLPEP